jgi:glycosyltransferase involved in cell wall biosynthesis
MKLSVAIITFNEEKNIERCLTSVLPVADEIVVVDSYSTDTTEEICKRFNVRFVKEKFRGHIEQKNYAMDLTANDFVLSLDADEELSPELTKSIKDALKEQGADAYKFNRLNSYCGKFIYHGTWYPDVKIRLWNKNKGRWGGENPHDKVIMNKNSAINKLYGDLRHYTYHTITEHITQMNKFSDIAAMESLRKGKQATIILHLVLNPLYAFIKSYFLKLGFLDGLAGFQVAISGSFYRFLKYSKLRDLQSKNNLRSQG